MYQWEKLAAAQARVQRISGPGDLHLVFEREVSQEIAELEGLLAEEDVDANVSAEARNLLGWLHWCRYLAQPDVPDSEDLATAVDMFLPVYINALNPASFFPERLQFVLATKAVPVAVDLLQRALASADQDSLDTAVDVWQHIADATAGEHPDWPGFLVNLAAALKTRYERFGDPDDLDDAVGAIRKAVAATPASDPDHVRYLSNLGVALRARFGHSQAPADLDEAIRIGRATVAAVPADHPHRAAIMSNLGNTLETGFERSGELADLNDAIDAMRSAVSATPAADHDRPRRLSNLGIALRARFERSGTLDDLDDALQANRAAVAAIPADHPDRAAALTNLGIALVARFERSGAVKDLDDAIRANRAAVRATPGSHPNSAARLSNLGAALRLRFERSGALNDLYDAIRADRAAVAAAPDGDPRRMAMLSNLGMTLQTAFRHSGAVNHLNDAIEADRAAVAAAPEGHPRRAAMLSNLGSALLTRFERSAAQTDLDEAVQAGRDAVAAAPADYPVRAAILSRLAVALLARFERSGAIADRRDAVAQCLAAVNVPFAEPSVRIRAAWLAAMLTGSEGSHGMADVLQTAVELLPELAPRHLLDPADRQRALSGYAGLAAAAASLALTDDSLPAPQRAARALRLLETGRAVLLSQVLDTRSDVTDLQEQHPELAKRFAELRDLLDGQADADLLTTGPRALSRELNAVLDRIRAQPGFESFAKLPVVDELLAQAAEGPVVTFNVSPYRSDALLLTTGVITTVGLPRLDIGTLRSQVSAFHQALGTAADALASASERQQAEDLLLEILGWLWDAAAEPVLDALGYRQPPPAGEWPRVWWATGGLLGLLPMHAAGHHLQPPAGRAVIDRVISSYTPTIRALRYARQQAAKLHAPSRSLIVAMPNTPGQAALPFAAIEAATLEARLPGPVLLIEPDPAPASDPVPPESKTPTRAAVLEQLPRCAIAHFACHGSHDPANPSLSRLLLHDHATAPLTVASLGPIRLGRAQLAYLSACRTAFHNAEQLLDESIHLATAFQLAGFPHVIATLWEIYDHVGVTMSDDFYAGLKTGKGDSTLDTTRAAQALHRAVRSQRELHRDLPFGWAAYLHAGA
jgi:tetratricopeptide (TPR) repeat protein